MRIILILAALMCTPATADWVTRQGSDSLRLTEVPCPEPIAKLLPPEQVRHFRVAVAMLAGQTHFGCWAQRADGAIYIVYTDGDAGVVPAAWFTADPGI